MAPTEAQVENGAFGVSHWSYYRKRRRHSLLNCLYLALEYPDDDDSDRQVYCPDIVDVVREIVQESVNRLDSVSLRPLVEAV